MNKLASFAMPLILGFSLSAQTFAIPHSAIAQTFSPTALKIDKKSSYGKSQYRLYVWGVKYHISKEAYVHISNLIHEATATTKKISLSVEKANFHGVNNINACLSKDIDATAPYTAKLEEIAAMQKTITDLRIELKAVRGELEAAQAAQEAIETESLIQDAAHKTELARLTRALFALRTELQMAHDEVAALGHPLSARFSQRLSQLRNIDNGEEWVSAVLGEDGKEKKEENTEG